MKPPTMQRKLLTAAVAAAIGAPAWADPPPRTDLPEVFCLRITDIERVEEDAEGDRFLFELEILNWTNRNASGFSVATNTATSAGVKINGAGVDVNGRGGEVDTDFDDIPVPGGDPNAPNPTEAVPFMSGQGNVDNPNVWQVLQQDENTAVWADTDLTFGGKCELIGAVCGSANEVDNIDLLFSSQLPARLDPTGTDDTGDTSIDGGAGVDLDIFPGSTFDFPVENALDGLVLDIDGFGEGDVLSLNWNLLAAEFFPDDGYGGYGDFAAPSATTGGGVCEAGMVTLDCYQPIGTSFGGGNAFGFGTLNLTRAAPGDAFVGPVFQNNVGFSQNPVLFYQTRDDQGNVIASVASIPNPTEIGGEIGAGQFGTFRDGTDLFGQTGNPNATFVQQRTASAPAPGTLLLLGGGMLGAFGFGAWRRRKTPRWS